MWNLFKKKKSVKPLLFLDIDGVIGPLARPRGIDWQELRTNGWCGPIIYDPQVIEELRVLSELCEIQWLTSWQEEANPAFEKIGLGPFPTNYQPAEHSGSWWKGEIVLEQLVADAERKVVWIDDELQKYLSADWTEEHQGFKARLEAHENILHLTPDSVRGLTPGDFKKVYNFIGHRPSA